MFNWSSDIFEFFFYLAASGKTTEQGQRDQGQQGQQDRRNNQGFFINHIYF